MSQLEGVRDLSEYVRRTNKVPIYNTVTLVMGTQSIAVSGIVLAQQSEALRELVMAHSEIYMDGLGAEGVQDCIELMYGGKVVLDEDNIRTIAKFSAMYKVSGMLALCRQWITEHVLEANLYSMIELGLELEVLGNGDVLELCKMFIIGTVKDGLFLLSQGWDLNNKHSFVKFLLDKDMLYFTLPLVTSWVSCDADIRYILELIECKELVFFGARATDLIEKMSDKMELVETSRRIIKLKISNVKEGSSTKEVGHDATSTSTEVAPGLGQLVNPAQCFSPQPNADLKILLKQDYKSFITICPKFPDSD